MKIAYIQGPFPRLCETYLLDQIVNLIQSGHQVDIIASHRSDHPKLHPDIERFNLEEGTRYMNLPETRGMQILKAIWLVLTNFHKAPRSIAKSLNFMGYQCPSLDIYLRVVYATIMLATTNRSNYDIIHCQMGYTGLMAVALRKIGVLNGKILTTFHGSDAYVYPHKWKHNVFKTLWEEGELNSVGTNYMGNTIKKLGAIPSTIRLLPLGLDLTKFIYKKRVLEEGQEIQLVSVARLVEKKGLAELAVRRKVRKRDISMHTMSEKGTQAQDAFMSVVETAAKLGVNAFDYLYDRITRQFNKQSLAELIANATI